MNIVRIKVADITKIKEVEECVIVYTDTQVWVCDKDQPMPKKDEVLLELKLKKLADE